MGVGESDGDRGLDKTQGIARVVARAFEFQGVDGFGVEEVGDGVCELDFAEGAGLGFGEGLENAGVRT